MVPTVLPPELTTSDAPPAKALRIAAPPATVTSFVVPPGIDRVEQVGAALDGGHDDIAVSGCLDVEGERGARNGVGDSGRRGGGPGHLPRGRLIRRRRGRGRDVVGTGARARRLSGRRDHVADRVHPDRVVVLDDEPCGGEEDQKGQRPDRHSEIRRRGELPFRARVPDRTVGQQHPVGGSDRDSGDLCGDGRGSRGCPSRRHGTARRSAREG